MEKKQKDVTSDSDGHKHKVVKAKKMVKAATKARNSKYTYLLANSFIEIA
jgi:hypothetical protein